MHKVTRPYLACLFTASFSAMLRIMCLSVYLVVNLQHLNFVNSVHITNFMNFVNKV